MRSILRNLAVRSHKTTPAQRRNAAALCSRHSQHNTSAAGLSTGRLVCQRHHPASSDGIIRSPFADENFDVVPFADYIFSQANRYGSKIALIDDSTGRSYTYSQIEDLSRRIGSFLTRQGYRKGDVVCYFGTNAPEFCLLLLGCASVGVVLTTANPAYTTAELQRQMEHSGAKAAFTVPVCVDRAREAGIKDITVIGEAEGCRPFSKVLEDDGKAFPSDVRIDPKNDVIVLPYSSGTTGLPKGVMLTHYNVVSNLRQFRNSLWTTTEDTNFAVLPFYHIYGMMPILFGTLQDGGSLVTTSGFDPVAFLETIVKHKVTQMHIVPPIILFLAKHPVVEKYSLSRIRTVVSAAAPLGDALSHEFIEKRKLPIKQGYGLTETSPVVSIDTDPPTVGSIGPLICNTEAKFIDPQTGLPVENGQPGELCVRGPQNMKGYFSNDRATKEMITDDGWLHTGDIGLLIENNRLKLTDRLKELIKYKGLQIAPAELEDIIINHPSVQDVAVVGVPDERAGEVPRAFVVCKPDSNAKESDIAKFVESQVSEYKQLRGGVKFITEIPKNPSGKILRRLLKED